MRDAAPGPVTICAVFAHPDDEAFGVSGTLAKYSARGVRTGLICVTRGAAGMTNGLADTRATLAELRTAELNCSAQAIGLDELAVLDFEDGQGERWERPALSAQVYALLARIRPSVVITFDPYGITRHPDHIAVHEVVRALVAAEGTRLGIRRLYYHVVTCPQEASPEGPALVCVPVEDVDVTVDIRACEAQKRAALACHRTQARDTAEMLGRPAGSLAAEHFQCAWAGDGWRPGQGSADLLAECWPEREGPPARA